MKHIFFFFMGLVLFSGCQKSTQPMSEAPEAIREAANAAFDDQTNFTMRFSPYQTYILGEQIFKAPRLGEPETRHFIVWKVGSQEKVFEKKIRGGTLEWKSDTVLEIFEPTGIPMEGRSFTYYYDLTTQKRVDEQVDRAKH